MPVIRISVDLARGAYPIHIGPGLLSAGRLLPAALGPANVVVTDETVAPLYLDTVKASCDGRIDDTVVLPAGESSKTLANVERIIDVLTANGCNRDAVLIALGGGVIGDMTGFAAAIYQRGIDFVQVPTTLLAQVDAAVGGKTAVNHQRGKNLIGAFHQPRCVISDTGTLATLDPRHGRAGLAEVIKHGLLGDAKFFGWLESNMTAIREHGAPLDRAIARCCEIKAAIVARDEHERGPRALLNLGHTFAHAIEGETGYEWLHGEAVAAGLVLAARLSEKMGLIDDDAVARVINLVAAAGLPTAPPHIPVPRWKQWMSLDKKALAGRTRFVVLDAIGAARLTDQVPVEALDDILGDTA